MTPKDRDLFRDALTDSQAEALTAWGEARNQSVVGLAAVIAVIRNRARIKGTRSSYQALQKAAFSCWLDDQTSTNDNALTKMALLLVEGKPMFDLTIDVCLWLASRPELRDPTDGATHYYAPKGVAHIPAWATVDAARQLFPKRTVTIGDHIFYRNVRF